MNIGKDACNALPVMLVTGADVVGIAAVMSLSSWSVR